MEISGTVLAGYNMMYSGCGASQYILYAVIFIIAPSALVGVFLFGEKFNFYHVLSVFAAVATILLFSAGQARV